jgi:hypothetical protein
VGTLLTTARTGDALCWLEPKKQAVLSAISQIVIMSDVVATPG